MSFKTISKKAWAIRKNDLILYGKSIEIVAEDPYYCYGDFVIPLINGQVILLKENEYLTLILSYKRI